MNENCRINASTSQSTSNVNTDAYSNLLNTPNLSRIDDQSHAG